VPLRLLRDTTTMLRVRDNRANVQLCLRLPQRRQAGAPPWQLVVAVATGTALLARFATQSLSLSFVKCAQQFAREFTPNPTRTSR
jgi:hypothetical protein